jgi:hypothetical protein
VHHRPFRAHRLSALLARLGRVGAIRVDDERDLTVTVEPGDAKVTLSVIASALKRRSCGKKRLRRPRGPAICGA